MGITNLPTCAEDRSGSYQVAVDIADTAVDCLGQQPLLALTGSIKNIGRETASTVETIHLSSL